jgi:hypothetical protein
VMTQPRNASSAESRNWRILYQSQIQIALHRVFTLRENTLLL